MSKKAKPPNKASQAATTFVALMDCYRYQQGPQAEPRPLTNFTFWAGAGFSKSWDEHAPVGKQLFTLDAGKLNGVAGPMVLSRLFGLNDNRITDDDLRQIVYQLDMYERYPDVCSRYIDPQNINIIRSGLRAAVVRRYDDLARLNYFDSEAEKFPLASPSSQQRSILNFFGHIIHDCADGSGDFIEGIRCHFVTTNYDYVIETILDNIFGIGDSLFLYAYRGFTPSGISKPMIPVLTHQHSLSQHLIKLNGGFEILREGDRYCLDYSNRSQSQITDKPPIIMLPSREQDYSDPYFRTIFPKAVRLMRDTKVLVLVGYSLPDDDALMRFILRQFAEEPEDARNKRILYIDCVGKAEKLERLQTVFPSIDELNVPLVATYEGSFADFAAECVSLIKDPEQIEV